MKLLLGDCLDKLKELEDNSIDSIVTDPPYGLSFMGKKWDYDVPSQQIWEECIRVLKPGGHLLAFAGSRTYHRMAVRIEDAGFDIRDQIMWIYGSGFPKSHNIGKNIEKIKVGGIKNLKQIGTKRGIKVETGTSGFSYSQEYVAGKSMGGKQIGGEIPVYEITNDYEGWGTALKPAHEPIVMARKPFKGSVAENVLEYGVGGINVDGCRIGLNDRGRFPANIILDEEAGRILDEQSGISKSTGGRSGNKEGVGQNGIYGQYNGEVRDENPGLGDIGGASRFFYCPKVSKKERDEGVGGEAKPIKGRDEGQDKTSIAYKARPTERQNIHPTVKPTDLMLYLIRLVTPKGGMTLDPFMGSGSTGKAAIRGGFQFVGIEREEDYMEIAAARIQYEIDNPYSEEKKERIKLDKNLKKFW